MYWCRAHSDGDFDSHFVSYKFQPKSVQIELIMSNLPLVNITFNALLKKKKTNSSIFE